MLQLNSATTDPLGNQIVGLPTAAVTRPKGGRLFLPVRASANQCHRERIETLGGLVLGIAPFGGKFILPSFVSINSASPRPSARNASPRGFGIWRGVHNGSGPVSVAPAPPARQVHAFRGHRPEDTVDLTVFLDGSTITITNPPNPSPPRGAWPGFIYAVGGSTLTIAR